MTNETNTDLRQERGRILSNDKRIKRIAGMTWLVPSQTQNAGGYVVNTAEKTCTCPDFELRRCKCKHAWAVEFVQTIETHSDGSTTVTESFSYSRTTHGQDWTAYNAAQTGEKDTVQALLRGLCEGVKTPEHAGRGPKPIPLSDVVFAMTMKTYGLMSARRATCDIEASAEAGNMTRAPHYNSTLAAFTKPEMTAILTALIERSASPLAAIETSFAVDSTGFGTCVYHRWYDEKYGKPRKKATWLKAHAMVGTSTGVITSVKVTASDGADCPQLPELVEATKQNFNLGQVAADKAYLSNENLTAIERAGAQPFVPFKLNSQQDGSPAWRKMHAVFILKQDEFYAAYAKRNNVESTFSSVKRKFGGAVKSKSFTAQVNEILCKILCSNLTVLALAMQQLGIQPSFLGLGEVRA
jgi:transposase